ncbi:MAG TPA: amino acid permease [Candidatus Thermoplasmatota archaeon]|nr:amino acid permease [Candidatus Thermoplasmatota archaeon]
MALLGDLKARYGVPKSPEAVLAETNEPGKSLKKSLGAFDLVSLGIGAIIGTGIFVLAGVGAQQAGPAIILSFIVVGFACALAGLCYAELAAAIPTSGSAYVYTYTALGEVVAWVLGWALVLEYAVGSVGVAIGWSGYAQGLLGDANPLPLALRSGPFSGGIVNVPAVLIVLLVVAILVRGTKESARLASGLVILKVAVVAFVVVLGALLAFGKVGGGSPVAGNFGPNLTTSFAPFGFQGIIAGGALIFFAYIGFDAVSTTAEETRNPKRDLPIGILGSLAICTVLYILAATVLLGLVPYQTFIDANTAPPGDPIRGALAEPFGYAFDAAGLPWAADIIRAGAIAGITSVLLVLILGAARVFFSLSRDGLVSPNLVTVHPRFGTPYKTTLAVGVSVAAAAAFVPLDRAAHITNIGTLFAFVLVCISTLVLRRRRPDLNRPFKVPLYPAVPILGAVTCAALAIFGLDRFTWTFFFAWMGLGLIVYALYGIRNSKVWKERLALAPTPGPAAAPGTGAGDVPRAAVVEEMR